MVIEDLTVALELQVMVDYSSVVEVDRSAVRVYFTARELRVGAVLIEAVDVEVVLCLRKVVIVCLYGLIKLEFLFAVGSCLHCEYAW